MARLATCEHRCNSAPPYPAWHSRRQVSSPTRRTCSRRPPGGEHSDPNGRGTGGPLKVSEVPDQNPLYNALFKAAVAAGPREKSELDVHRLHAHGLQATLQRD